MGFFLLRTGTDPCLSARCKKADLAHRLQIQDRPARRDRPAVNPMKKLVGTGATFVARTHASSLNHMIQMIERTIVQ